MTRPEREIEGCHSAHARLSETLDAALSDRSARQSTGLEGWTVGHIVSHLARNAEAMCRRLDALTRGETIEQYIGGSAGRADEIEAGATRTAAELVDDVTQWSQRLEERFATLPDECWDQAVRTVSGSEHPAHRLPFRRWREVELHHVDLHLGYSPADWPPEFVQLVLPNMIAGLTERADPPTLLAWISGRGPAPHLRPWG